MQNSDPPAGEAECRILKKGFTLIELLVVMAIIGILAALALTSFNTAQKNSRDTRRKSDLQQYRNALEAYASNNGGLYPGNAESGRSCDPAGNPTGIFLDDGASPGGPIINEYLPAKIADPIEACSGTACDGSWCAYYYQTSDNGLTFVLETRLETRGHWQICSKGTAGKTPSGGVMDSTCDLP